MTSNSWLTQLRDAQEKEPDANVFALATLTTQPSLRPRVRYTLSLGLVESEDKKKVFLLASTSAQSSKVKEIMNAEETSLEARMVEVAWLFPQQQLQFRVLSEGHVVPHSKHSSTIASDLSSVILSDGKDWQNIRQQEVEKLSCSHLSAQYSSAKDEKSADEDFILLAMEAKEVTINQIGKASQSFVL